MDQRLEDVVRAFVAEMIPTDDLPGATEAGTAADVLRALDASPELWDGVRALDSACMGIYGVGFPQATGDQRRGLMDQLARGETPAGWSGRSAQAFWTALRNLSLSLFYGSPISRQITGFPGPSVDLGGYRHTIIEPDPS